jgi:hypothetical protein
VTIARVSHPPKQRLDRVSTDDGMQIDCSDEQFLNADSPIDESLDTASKITLERVSHALKQPLQRESTDDGMQID